MSLNNALITSIVGLYSFYNYRECGIANYDCGRGPFEDFGCVFFMCYLVSDMIIGSLEYPRYMNFFAGYVHHLIFLPVTFVMYNTEMSKCLALIIVIEVSTIFLALKCIVDRGSITYAFSNSLFALTFAYFRIWFTGELIVSIILHKNSVYYPFVFVLVPMLMVHMYWFKEFLYKEFKPKVDTEFELSMEHI
jgi:hypothetical protein